MLLLRVRLNVGTILGSHWCFENNVFFIIFCSWHLFNNVANNGTETICSSLNGRHWHNTMARTRCFALKFNGVIGLNMMDIVVVATLGKDWCFYGHFCNGYCRGRDPLFCHSIILYDVPCLIYFPLWFSCIGHILTGTLQIWISLANCFLLRHYIWKVLIFWQGSTEVAGIVVNVINTIGTVYNQNWKRPTMNSTLTTIFCIATFLYESIGIMARSVEFQICWTILCEPHLQQCMCDEHLCMAHCAQDNHIGFYYKLSSMYPLFLN
jgi:hypothetical protein